MSGEPAAERRPHPNLVVRDEGPVRVLRIDREDKLGALSSALVDALGAEFASLADEEAVRAVVLTGTGRGFVAGADIGEYAEADAAAFRAYQVRSRAVFDALATLPQATIAAVNGYAFGGGFELALCCDVILASDRARFGLPEVKLGLIPGGGGLARLPRFAGLAWTRDVVLSGRTVTADEAAARGVVAEVVSGEELLARAIERAGEFAAHAPGAVRAAKGILDGAAVGDRDLDALVGLFASPDGREGIAAFAEKRPPVFGSASPPAE